MPYTLARMNDCGCNSSRLLDGSEHPSDPGCSVEFLEPKRRLPSECFVSSLLVDKEIWPIAFQRLYEAGRIGVSLWNGFAVTTMFCSRLIHLQALKAVGCRISPMFFKMSTDRAYVARLEMSGARGLDVDFINVNGRFYAVDVNPGAGFHAVGLEEALATSILHTCELNPFQSVKRFD